MRVRAPFPLRNFRTPGPLLIAVGIAVALAGCAGGPGYQPPQVSVPASWQAPMPHGGSPAAMQQWWQQFEDPVLNRLIEQAEAQSPGLAQAWASIEKARATLTSSESAGLPGATGGGSVTRTRQPLPSGQLATSTGRSAGLDASWEIDLFGRVRRTVEAAQARVDARISDWHEARVSLAAEVADTFARYRTCVLLGEAYAHELVSTVETHKATAAAVWAGFTAPSDGALARASVSAARSAMVSQRAQCELLVKSLVDLTGSEEPTLRALLEQGAGRVPQPRAVEVQSVPADVLRQRPDLASLERELAAASAEVGAARADLYPSLSLLGSISRSAVGGSPSITTWSFGPTLTIPLLDGGRRRAAVRSAQADYDSALAAWRQRVRTVVKEVEQALINLESAGQQTDDAIRAAAEYRRYFQAVEANWRAGNDSLLTLEQARRSALTAEINMLTLQQSRVQYWIALYKALGGGWQPGEAASPPIHDTVQGGTS